MASGSALVGAVTSTADEFLFRLARLQGHPMVGHDLLKAGKPKLALPHFGHPVPELYAEAPDLSAIHWKLDLA